MSAQKVLTFPAASHNRQTVVSQPAVSRPVAGAPAAPALTAGKFEDLRSFGEYLRAHRERRRITLAQIARNTKLIMSRLEGLERGDVDPLPAGIYRRAIVRAYASAVGLDPEEMVAEFQKLTVLETGAPELPLPTLEQIQPQAAAESGWRLPQALGSIAAGIAVGALALMMNQQSEAPTAPVVVQSQSQTQSQAADAPSAAPTSAGAVATSGREELAGADIQLVSQTVAAPVAKPVADTVSGTVPETTPAPPPVADNTLRITSSPSGARVTVNGIGWGSTPLAIPNLPSGTKTVRLTKDGYAGAETTVTLGDNRPASVSLNLQALDAR